MCGDWYVVLSAFYWGYALGQIPASRLAEKYGAARIFGLSVLIPSIITLFVPAAARTSFGMALATRAILGFFESANFPCVFQFYPRWIPIAEKPIMIGVISAGMYSGEILGFGCSGYLTSTEKFMIGNVEFGGWDMVFYVFGTMGILWYPLYSMYAYETPEVHPSITKEELDWIHEGKEEYALDVNPSAEYTGENSKLLPEKLVHATTSISPSNSSSALATGNPLFTPLNQDDLEGHSRRNSKNSDAHERQRSAASVDYATGVAEIYLSPVPEESEVTEEGLTWTVIFTHPVALTQFFQAWVYGWIGFTLLSEMPSYLTDELGFDLSSAGLLSVLPYLMLFIATVLSGRMFTYLHEEKGWSIRDVRQTSEQIGLLGAGAFLVLCGYITNVPVAFTCMIVAQGIMGFIISGVFCAYLDFAPKNSAFLNTIGNTIGAIAGIGGPILVGVFTSVFEGSLGWRLVFWVAFAQCVVAIALWHKYQSSEVVPELNVTSNDSLRQRKK